MCRHPHDYAVVIGIDHYPAYQSLRGCVASAEAFYRWLISPQGGGLVPANCRRFYSLGDTSRRPPNLNASDANLLAFDSDRRPHQPDIDQVLCDLLDGVTGGRRLYVYFNGHGLAVRDSGGAALCLSAWSLNWRHMCLNSESYRKRIASYGKFPQIMMFLDCCRSNVPLTEGYGLGCENARSRGEDTRFWSAYGAPENLQAFEGPSPERFRVDGQEHEVWGYFSRTLMRALLGQAADRANGVVTASRLADYLRDETKALAAEDGKRQAAVVDQGMDGGIEVCRTPVQSNVEIAFKAGRTGRVELESPSLEVIQSGDARDGSWQLTLSRGRYTLRDTQSGEELSLPFVPASEVLRVTF